jgi:hypothetical protein
MRHAILVHPGSALCAREEAVAPADEQSMMAAEFLAFPKARRAVILGGLLDDPLDLIPRPLRQAVQNNPHRVSADPQNLRAAARDLAQTWSLSPEDSVLICGGWADPADGCAAEVARGLRAISGVPCEIAEYAFYFTSMGESCPAFCLYPLSRNPLHRKVVPPYAEQLPPGQKRISPTPGFA